MPNNACLDPASISPINVIEPFCILPDKQCSASDGVLSARWISAHDVNSSLREQWAQLEQAAIEPNAFLSPDFVLPAVDHLAAQDEVQLVLIESTKPGGDETSKSNRTTLVGLGAFTVQKGNRRFPFPHLQAFLSEHTYLTGLLIDRSCADAALKAFWQLIRNDRRWHGVNFVSRTKGTELGTFLEQTGRDAGAIWSEEWSHERAMLRPAALPDDFLSTMSKNRRKSLRKSQRQLEQLGPVTFRTERPTADCDLFTTTFLELEDSGWKNGEGTSLLSSTQDSRWFTDAVAAFASRGNAVFCELLLGDTPVASTINFASGNELFAFKLGWDSSLASHSPGTLNELQTVLAAKQEWSDFQQVDSCASQGSFIEKLWSDRRTVTTGYFATSYRSRVWRAGLKAARAVKHRLHRNVVSADGE